MICSDELGRDTALRESQDFLGRIRDQAVTWLISRLALEVRSYVVYDHLCTGELI